MFTLRTRLNSRALKTLRDVINGKYDEFVSSIEVAKAKAEALRASYAAIVSAIPSINDISQPLRCRFTTAADNLKDSLSAMSGTMQVAISLLAQKAAAPNTPINSDALTTASASGVRDELLKGQIVDFNNLITLHNVEHDNFDSVKEKSCESLKQHYLATGQLSYSTYLKDEKDAKTELDRLEAEYAWLTNEEERIKKEVRKHGPAAKLISDMVCNHLGRSELEISLLDDGYELRRCGERVKGSLSEGEKTAIALCYFLSTLEAEGRKRENLIVVIDDPVSSLDTKAMNYSFSVLKSLLGGVSQLFLLTHNLQFMNETKKWLKSKTEKENQEATATLLFLDAVQQEGQLGLCSSIKELPKYIRDYESEYQYLFHLVKQFAESPDGFTGYLYVMPNAMRKVLEIFLAFKYPGSEGLSSKIEAITKSGLFVNGAHGLREGHIRALDRLVQLESHADNLDDLVSFSSMTVEETKDAANVLLKMMNALDEVHYNRLNRICRA